MTTIEAPITSSAPVADLKEYPEHRSDTQRQNYDEETAVDLLTEAGVNPSEIAFYGKNLEMIADLITDGDERSIELAQKQFETLENFLSSDEAKGTLSADQREAIEHLLVAAVGDQGMVALNPDARAWAGESPNAERNAYIDSEEYDLIEDTEPFEDSIIDTIDGLLENDVFSETEAEDLAAVVLRLAKASDERDATLTKELDSKLRFLITEMVHSDDEFNEKITEAIRVAVAQKRNKTVTNPDLYQEAAPVPGEGYQIPGGATAIDLDNDNAAIEAAQNTDTIDATDRSTIGKRMKLRWTALKAAIMNPTQMEHWKDVFGDKNGEHVKRNAIVTAVMGAAAVGLAVKNGFGGLDVMPAGVDGDGTNLNPFELDVMPAGVDGDGIDLNPFNNGGNETAVTETNVGAPISEPTVPDTGSMPDVGGTDIAFKDTINQGDGVTNTMKDFLSQRHGKNLSSEQMGQIWREISSKNSPAEISSWFPGSSVGGEWGVTYGGTGTGGMTGKGVQAVEQVAKQLGFLG